jgi:peptidoglycan-associated lipoprotein
MSGRAIVIAGCLFMLAASGCAKQPSAFDASASALPGAARDGMGSGSGVGANADERPDAREYVAVPEMPDVHFAFDQYALRPEAKRVLDAGAAWLKARPDAKLMIEGHCDERGTGEYNFALGERRAKTSKDYLVSRGIDARRIAVVSYGEERPVCHDAKESCWLKNRRAHFLVKGQ